MVMRNNQIALERGRFTSDPGSSEKILYDPVMNKDGIIELVPTGKVNTDEIIESYAESVTLENIINRFANGDPDALNRYEPLYMDLMDFPKTYAEILQANINAERGFDALPVNIKQKYNNNFREWLSKCGTDEWINDLGLKKPEPIAEVIKDDEKQ